MTNDEAEKLARKTITTMQQELGMANIEWREIRKLCDYVLSGNMKREIENAAYRKAASIAASHVKRFNGLQIAEAIEALIQPPAQIAADLLNAVSEETSADPAALKQRGET